jgi:4-amino-4-deoxy-L-arabinose transferase-like glycosyltransferase
LVRHSTNYELFVDEITYSNVGLAIAQGKGAVLYGQPFFLHPPGLMFVLAAAMRLLGRPGTTLALVMHLRVVNAVIGTVDVAVIMALVKRVAGPRWAMGAGLLIALEPFVLIYDGRVMLETLATTATASGMLGLITLGQRVSAPTHEASSSRRSDGGWNAVLALGTGVAFGIAVLTKETYVLASVAPVGVLLVSGRFLPRRWSGAVLLATVGCYGAYLASVALSGEAKGWWDQQQSGLLRAVGSKQISGFNQSGHVGFATRLFATAANYAGTYAVMALAATAVVWGLWAWWRSGRRSGQVSVQDVMVLWAACTGFYVAFSIGRGAFEQQIFYPFIVAALPATVAALKHWTQGRHSGRGRRTLVVGAATLVGLVLVYDTAVDLRVRTHTDAAYISTVRWMDAHSKRTDLVDATDGTSQFTLHGVRIDTIYSLAGVLRYHPNYVISASALVNQGYVRLTGGLQRYLARVGTVVHRANDTSAIGPLLIYRLDWPRSREGTK